MSRRPNRGGILSMLRQRPRDQPSREIFRASPPPPAAADPATLDGPGLEVVGSELGVNTGAGLGIVSDEVAITDADLLAILALSTTAFGRSLLELADATAGRSALGAAAAAHAHVQADITNLVADLAAKQPLDSDLTAIAALSTTPYGRSLLEAADAAGARTLLALGSVATLSQDNALPWSIDIDPFTTPATQTGYANLTLDASQLHGGYKNSLVQNDEIGWDVVLAAGTWTVSILTLTASNQGIFTVSLDGSSVGTIDLYTAGIAYRVIKTITGISVAATGKKRLLFKAATKNASSSGFVTSLSAVALRRTA